MMEHAEHSPAAIREKAAGGGQLPERDPAQRLDGFVPHYAGLQLGTRHVRHQLWLRCAGIYP